MLSDDAQTLLGGVLVGDASSYGVLRPLVGSQPPGDPVALIAPAGSGDGPAIGVRRATRRGTDLLVQQRHQGGPVFGHRRRRVHGGRPQGLHRSGHLMRIMCAAVVTAAAPPKALKVAKALCEHFSQSRTELFEIVQASGVRTFTGLIERYGTGTGCDICKPVVASILASTSSEHILDGEQASLQDTNDHFLANLQRNGTYSVVPRVPGGDITPEQLILIGEIARDFGLYTKITGGQRIDMFGATRRPATANLVTTSSRAGMESGHAYGKALRTVKSCVGHRLVPLRPAGLRPDGHRSRVALPRTTSAAQDQDGACRGAPANAPRPAEKMWA